MNTRTNGPPAALPTGQELHAWPGVRHAVARGAVDHRPRVLPVLLSLLSRICCGLLPPHPGVPHLPGLLRTHRLAQAGPKLLAGDAGRGGGIPHPTTLTPLLSFNPRLQLRKSSTCRHINHAWPDRVVSQYENSTTSGQSFKHQW